MQSTFGGIAGSLMDLRAIGFWKGSDAWLADPAVIVRRLGRRQVDVEVAAYLRGGHVLNVYRGYSSCRFRCGVASELMGHADLTDGTWLWPEGLVCVFRTDLNSRSERT